MKWWGKVLAFSCLISSKVDLDPRGYLEDLGDYVKDLGFMVWFSG